MSINDSREQRRQYKSQSPLRIKYEYILNADAEQRVAETFDFLFDKIKKEYQAGLKNGLTNDKNSVYAYH